MGALNLAIRVLVALAVVCAVAAVVLFLTVRTGAAP